MLFLTFFQQEAESLWLGYTDVLCYQWLKCVHWASAAGKCTLGYGLAVSKSADGFVAFFRLKHHSASLFLWLSLLCSGFFYKATGGYLKNFY